MKSNLMIKIGFASLVLLNLVLIFLLVVKPAGPGMKGRNVTMEKIISDKLNFDEAQRLLFVASAKSHNEEMMKLNHQQMKAMNEYFSLLKSEQIDEDQKATAFENLKEIEGKKVSITYNHFEELKSICKEDQLSEFDEVVNQVIPMLLGSGKNIPPPPRDK